MEEPHPGRARLEPSFVLGAFFGEVEESGPRSERMTAGTETPGQEGPSEAGGDECGLGKRGPCVGAAATACYRRIQ